MKLTSWIKPLAVVALATLGPAVSTASATAPGKNGQLVFRRYLDAARTTGALFVSNPDGSRVRQLTHPGQGVIDQEADWAPNGKRIAFERRFPCPAGGPKNGLDDKCDVVYTVGRDGKGLKPLVPCDFAEHCHVVDTPAWSPDGSKIAYAYGVSAPSYTGSFNFEQAIWIIDASGSRAQQVTQLTPGTSWDSGPQWSPDGQKLVFVRADLQKQTDAVFTVAVDGSDLAQVTPWELNAGDGPDWSPDGKWLVFRAQPSDSSSNLYKSHPDGSGLVNMTKQPAEGLHYLSSSFSPDGKMIVSARTPGAGPDGAADIILLRADGSHARAVTKTRLWESAADWGPRVSAISLCVINAPSSFERGDRRCEQKHGQEQQGSCDECERPPLLEQVASHFALRPVDVRCPSLQEWVSDPIWGTDPNPQRAWGYTDMVNDFTVIQPVLCNGALAVTDPTLPAWQRATGVLVLVHESFHLRHWTWRRNEGKVEC
jgi:TolB protein